MTSALDRPASLPGDPVPHLDADAVLDTGRVVDADAVRDRGRVLDAEAALSAGAVLHADAVRVGVGGTAAATAAGLDPGLGADLLREPLHETERIMRTASLWVAAAILAPVLALGPLVASGWRPNTLPLPSELAFWLGSFASAGALGLLVWAACPVPAFPLEQAHPQKRFSVRVGIVAYLAGSVVAGMAILLSPAG